MLGFDVVAEARDVPGWGTTGDCCSYRRAATTIISGSTRGSPRAAGLSPTASRACTTWPSPTRRAGRFADAYRRLKAADWPIRQTADHGTHEAIYITDPDGNDVELQWDRPVEAWPRDEQGHWSDSSSPSSTWTSCCTELD